jgi:hypothetical protein
VPVDPWELGYVNDCKGAAQVGGERGGVK